MLNHSSKKSWPEKIFEDLLNENGISGWVYNFRSGRYAYDYAFPDVKVDVEIDGATHLLEQVRQSDLIRDEYSAAQGWRVFRIEATLLYDKSKHTDVVDRLIDFIADDRIFGQLKKPVLRLATVEEKRAIKEQKRISAIKAQVELLQNANIDFSQFGWKIPAGLILEMKPECVARWMKKNMRDFYTQKCAIYRNKR